VKFSISIIITFIIALLFLASQVFAQGWVWQSSGTTRNLLGVCFTDAYHGVVVGESGTILRTTNGGVIWNTQYSGVAQHLRSVAFADSSNGIAAGDGGLILRTTDGGNNWLTQSSGHVCRFNGVSYPSLSKAYVVGDSGIILTSSDAGNTWANQVSGNSNTLNSVSFVSKDIGVVVDGGVTRTTDGGMNWSYIRRWDANCVGVSFKDDVIYLTDNYQGFDYLNCRWAKSIDSGLTWYVRELPLFYRTYGISFVDKNIGTVVGSGLICQTLSGGSKWNYIYTRFKLKAVSSTESTSQTAVGDNGAIVRTYDGRWIPPDIELNSPTDKSSSVPFTFESTTLVVKLKWRKYLYTVDLSAHYRVQVGTDSTFQSNILVDYTQDRSNYNMVDTALIVSSLQPLTKYFWRVCVTDYGYNESGWSKWSATWGFTTSDFPRATIRQIQEISHDSLLVADSLQNTKPARAVLQHSQLRDSLLFITVRCIYPPSVFACRPARMVVCDTIHEISPWHGITVHFYQGDSLAFMNVQRGQILTICGRVREEPINNMNSNTVFKSVGFEVVGSDSSSITPLLVNVSDFFEGVLPQGKSKYSTGEPYEGSVVEFHNLTVHSVLSPIDGMVNLSDGAGNIMATSDISRWFTLQSHRDPLSAYSIPPIGSHIDKIRGVLSTEYGAESGVLGSRYRIAPIDLGDFVFVEQCRGVIKGTIFNDENRDSVRTSGEQGLANWHIIVSGKVSAVLTTSENGEYSISGLDSGLYSVTISPNSGWVKTKPEFDQYSFYLGLNDTVAGKDYGVYYQWCSIDGIVFYDYNENGIRDTHDKGVLNCTVEVSGSISKLVQTDSNGYYIFQQIEPGTYSISLHPPSGYEQMLPRFHCGYNLELTTYDKHSSNNNFAIRPVPNRVKLKISVQENTGLQKEIEWGIRPGASYGIWHVDPSSTDYDYSEGECEIPPQVYGLFDARFVDSRRTSTHFGCGAYTDMRDFISAWQIDTFKLNFQPGYMWGGDYPMILRWSKSDVRNAFPNYAEIVDKFGGRVDMRWNDFLVVYDPAITYLLIITCGPNIPATSLKTWKMLSIPLEASDPRVWSIFRPSDQTGFSYLPAGYSPTDSLIPGIGYWIKCTTTIDSSGLIGPQRLLDTVNVSEGWNLIGTLNSPTLPSSIEAIPPEMNLGSFFGYNTAYSVSDMLEPYKAYWVKASQAGRLVMRADGSFARVNEYSSDKLKDIIKQSNRLIVQDRTGKEALLYFTDHKRFRNFDLRLLDVPPLPPTGMFDVRFGSDRMMEVIQSGEEKEYPILISSSAYPIKINYDLNIDGCTASLKINKKLIELKTSGMFEIKEPTTQISLIVKGISDLPKSFELYQNYPNPFNPITRIQYALPMDAKVKLVIYNTLGQRVVTLVDQVIHAGYQSVEWNASNMASGVYFYNLEATGGGAEKTFTQIRKMIVVK
jgi:photosystem II stability/assembly factor-like uncharacterized protein